MVRIKEQQGNGKERCGFTLVELIVAIGVFSLLGMGATAFMVMAVSTWRQAELRRDVSERAELVFLSLKKDIQCLYTDGKRVPFRSVFFSDYDEKGRQRLLFTRTVPPPGADPRIAGSGRSMAANDPIDGTADLRKLRGNLLLPPGDLLSVAYFVSDEKLYRAARTPAVPYGALQSKWWEKGGDMVAERIMHIEYNFWSDKTASWQPEETVMGPSYYWDSTMGVGHESAVEGASSTRFVFTGSGSAADPGDDLFPRLIEIKLVVAYGSDRPYTFLTAPLDADTTDIQGEDFENYPSKKKENFVKIDKEWISYKTVAGDGKRFFDVKRGRRGSKPAVHEAGALIRYGVTFRMVTRPPCQRGGWRRVR